MTTKIDIINDAYSRGAMSGLTTSPTPEDLGLALKRLENMAHRWAKKNICVGYNFEENPIATSVHNIPREYWDAFETGLMMVLLTDFGKEPTMALASTARAAFNDLLTATAEVPEYTYPNRMPVGSGNRGYGRFQRYYGTVEKAPIEYTTAEMATGNISGFYEDFAAYLNAGETLSSFVLTSDTGLTVTSDVISGSRITYTVEAESSGILEVKIVATTSDSRVETRVKTFEVTDIEI